MAPVSMGPRELADVILPPFEMAIRIGGARSVMPTYIDIDGVPASADPSLLTRLLRDELGFDGLVVSDYFAVSFIQLQHRIAADPAGAAALALAAGLDVELPSTRCFGEPLLAAVTAGDIPEQLIDRAAARVLRQKLDLGLLDPGWSPLPADGRPAEDLDLDLDPPAQRDIARRLAEESVVLLANDQQALPLPKAAKVAVIGPLADDPLAFFGCYTMPRHLGHQAWFDSGSGRAGVEVATVLAALRAELPDVSYARGCDVATADRSGFAEAVTTGRSAELIVAVVGDEAGLSGTGPAARGATSPTSTSPGCSGNCCTRWPTPARRWWRCSSPAGRTRSATWRAGWRPRSRRSSPARRAAGRSPGCSPGG